MDEKNEKVLDKSVQSVKKGERLLRLFGGISIIYAIIMFTIAIDIYYCKGYRGPWVNSAMSGFYGLFIAYFAFIMRDAFKSIVAIVNELKEIV